MKESEIYLLEKVHFDHMLKESKECSDMLTFKAKRINYWRKNKQDSLIEKDIIESKK